MSQSSPASYGETGWEETGWGEISDKWFISLKTVPLDKLTYETTFGQFTKFPDESYARESYGDPTDARSRLTSLQEEVVRRLFEALPVAWRLRVRDPREAIVQYNDSGRTPREIAEWYERALVLR